MRRSVTWGLLAAFVVHDLEELLTMPSWVSAQVERLRRTHPQVPERVWRTLDVGPAHTSTAIGLMGVLVGAAAAAGARTGGRSRFFQNTLVGFGWHALTHVAQSVAVRGYTPGVITTPLVVAPFSLWAWRELGRAGVRHDDFATRDVAVVAAVVPAVIVGTHALAFAVTAATRSGGSRNR